MDLLEQTIDCLTAKEKKSFRTELISQKNVDASLQLFDLLKKDKKWKEGELSKKIYAEPNSAAYYALRKRLVVSLVEFLIKNKREAGNSGNSQVSLMISLVDDLFRRESNMLAIDLLEKAEKLACEARSYYLLDRIYQLKFTYSDLLPDNEDEVYAKWENNLKQLQLMGKLNASFAKVRNKLKKLRKDGAHFDLQETVRDVLADYNFSDRALLTNPVFMHRLAELCRSVIISTKEYQRFKPYLLKANRTLVAANAFVGFNKDIENDFIYMIAHTLYRSQNFSTASTWLDKLIVSMNIEEQKTLPIYSKYIGIRAGIDFYTGNLQQAIVQVEDIIMDEKAKIPEKEFLNLKINLAVYHFFDKKFLTCNKYIQQLPLRNRAMEVSMSKEWFFKRDLIEVIVQYELQKVGIARQLLKAIQKNYASMLEEPIYQRAKVFIGLVHSYFESPEKVRTPEFIQRVEEARKGWADQAQDIHAILYFSWFRSKVLDKDGYELVTERVAEKVGDV
jgi:hypothetical protein